MKPGEKNLLLTCGILFCLVSFSFFVKPVQPEILGITSTNEITRDSVFQMTNEMRIKNGCKALKENKALDLVAQHKADDMVKRQYFSHTDPDGNLVFASIKKVYKYRVAGENLAVSYSDVNLLEEAWMNSKSHRDNTLRPDFKETGVGISVGGFKGYPNVIYVVQLFGKPY